MGRAYTSSGKNAGDPPQDVRTRANLVCRHKERRPCQLRNGLTFFNLISLLNCSADSKKALATTERLIELYTTQEQPDKAIEKIQSLLPGSPLYDILEEKPNQMETLRTLAGLQEKTDSEFFDREVKLRRGRLGGGTLEQVQNTVRNELYTKSEVTLYFRSVMAQRAICSIMQPLINSFTLQQIAGINIRVNLESGSREQRRSGTKVANFLHQQNRGDLHRQKGCYSRQGIGAGIQNGSRGYRTSTCLRDTVQIHRRSKPHRIRQGSSGAVHLQLS